jgi:hypothetical protein
MHFYSCKMLASNEQFPAEDSSDNSTIPTQNDQSINATQMDIVETLETAAEWTIEDKLFFDEHCAPVLNSTLYTDEYLMNEQTIRWEKYNL